MSPTTSKKELDRLFFAVASYRGTVWAVRLLAALLIAALLLLIPEVSAAAFTPVYILVVLALFPSPICTALSTAKENRIKKTSSHTAGTLTQAGISKDQMSARSMPSAAEKGSGALPLPLFCKKYHFSPERALALNFTYIIAFFLLLLWQGNYYPQIPKENFFLFRLPTILAVLSLFTRIFTSIGFRLYFWLFPVQAMR